MDFSVVDDLAEHREAARVWAEANVDPAWAKEQHESGTHQTAGLHRLLARDGLLGAGWPPEYGGTDVDPGFAHAVMDELRSLGLMWDGWSTTVMVINTISHVGSEEQKRTIIPAALRGELLISLGYSEPDSGSDVAAASTRAVRDGEEWVIDGQKMFTSTAQVCSHVFVLTRTNAEVPKHKGLTLFLVPTAAAGFDLQPIYTLGGQQTNATFYSGVRVPDSARIGGVDAGWSVMHVALTFERAGDRRAGVTLARKVADWVRRSGGEYGIDMDDAVTRERLARIAIDEEVAGLLGMRVRWISESGGLPRAEGSMQKLFASEASLPNWSTCWEPAVCSRGMARRWAATSRLTSARRSSGRSTVGRARSSERSSPSCDWVSPRAARPPDQATRPGAGRRPAT